MHVIIAMPVYNDWDAAAALCRLLRSEFELQPSYTAEILLLDDGSSLPVDVSLFEDCTSDRVSDIKLLSLARNLGHQRAIAIGLTYIQQNLSSDAVVIMDADGEDRASDVPRLLAKLDAQTIPQIVFAERGRRIEGAFFKIFYLFYRALHLYATGTGIRVGNFSAIPFERLRNLVVLPELWNHYAAAVFRARIPHTTVRADRAKRLYGKSKMNFVSLVIHGLSALFAHSELVGTRIFMSLLAISVALLLLFFLLSGIAIHRGYSVPLQELLIMQTVILLGGDLLAISFGLVFFIMMGRTNQGFLPVRDYQYFVLSYASLFHPGSASGRVSKTEEQPQSYIGRKAASPR